MLAYCFLTGMVKDEKVQEFDFQHMALSEKVLEMLHYLSGGCFGLTGVADCQSIPCMWDCYHFLTLQLVVEPAGPWLGNKQGQETLRLRESRQYLQRILGLSCYDLQPLLLLGHRGVSRCGLSISQTYLNPIGHEHFWKAVLTLNGL